MIFKLKNGCARLAIIGLLLTTVSLQATTAPVANERHDCACGTVGNIVKTGQTSNTISFSWDDVSGATGYEVWYVRVADNYTSTPAVITNTGFTFSGLSAGRYVFYITTKCGGEQSEIMVLEDIMVG